HLMGPPEANVLGNVHGGVIMKLVDEAGALAAMRHARAPVVTVAIDSMTFLEPILVGAFVTVQAELTHAGRTSMEVRAEVVAENPITGAKKHTNTAYLVYVSVDSTGKPSPIPKLVATTPQESAAMQAARERQERRVKNQR
ncbi:MAG TPA: acyl-CoA thioesterase, partial [Aggregatilineales bacterium]|nr:acyl-CoA thioesterase [Aggregatilineales bacterium]